MKTLTTPAATRQSIESHSIFEVIVRDPSNALACSPRVNSAVLKSWILSLFLHWLLLIFRIVPAASQVTLALLISDRIADICRSLVCLNMGVGTVLDSVEPKYGRTTHHYEGYLEFAYRAQDCLTTTHAANTDHYISTEVCTVNLSCFRHLLAPKVSFKHKLIFLFSASHYDPSSLR